MCSRARSSEAPEYYIRMIASPIASLFSLDGRTALVTGGGRGLGKAMATALAGAGAKIAVVDIDDQAARASAAELAEMGVPTLGLQGDVTNEADAARSVSEVIDSWGALDILINNAGIAILAPAEEASLADFK